MVKNLDRDHETCMNIMMVECLDIRRCFIKLLNTVLRLKSSMVVAFVLVCLFILFSPRSYSQDALDFNSNRTALQKNREDLLRKRKAKEAFTGDWNLSMGFFSYEEDTDDSKSVRANMNLRPTYKLADPLRLKGDFRINTESGRTQTRFEQGTDRFLWVSNASLEYNPLKSIVLEAGILNQSFLHQELMFSNQRAFGGAKIGYVDTLSDIKTEVYLQQGLPSSVSLNTERAEKEELPLFASQSLNLCWCKSSWNLEVGGLLYQYQNLPSKVAFESRVNGNTVIGPDVANSIFLYGFSGYALHSRVQAQILNNFTVAGSLQVLENQGADSGNNRGQIAWVGPALKVGKMKFAANYGQFFAEPDVIPAYYMSLLYGGTNRQGQFGRLEAEFMDYNFKIVGQYVEADPINPRVFQFSRNNYLIRLETLYVTF